MGALVDQYTKEIEAGERDPADLRMAEMMDRDRDSWERELKAAGGALYDPSDLEGVIRNLSYAANDTGGTRGDAATYINNARRTYAQRLASTGGGGDDSGGTSGAGGGGGNSGGGGGNGGGGAGGFPTFAPPSPLRLPDPYAYPDYVAPDPFAYDAYTLAQPFAYGDFQAPTGQSILSDPSYQFRLEQGQKALDASAANRGTLRTGGHLKDTIGYGQNFASQEYGNIYNRAAEQYGTNRNNAQQSYAMNEANRAGAYGTNYNVAKDIYGINAAGKAAAYGTNRQNAQEGYQSQYNTAKDLYGSQYQTAQDLYNAQQRTAELQFGREWDAYKYANDQKFNYWNAQLGADSAKYRTDVGNL